MADSDNFDEPVVACEKNQVQFDNLATFSLDRILSENSQKKTIVAEGHFTDRDGKAILLLEKTPFNEKSIASLCSTKSKLEEQLSNDVYRVYSCHSVPTLGDTKTTIIFPATEKHVKKYEIQPLHIIEETPNLYKEITLPFINSESFNIQWVYNILTHHSEEESIVFEDPDPVNGFVLIPDLKWDRNQINNLYLLAIVHRHDIKSLRDLTSEHLPLLKNIRDKGIKAVEEKFAVKKSRLRIYFHYQPSYYHLHVHFTHLQFEAPGIHTEKSHLLNTVIDNIEMVSDYYQKCTLSFVVKETDKLFRLFNRLENGTESNNEDDHGRLKLKIKRKKVENEEDASESVFESSLVNNSDSCIISGSEDENPKHKSIFIKRKSGGRKTSNKNDKDSRSENEKNQDGVDAKGGETAIENDDDLVDDDSINKIRKSKRGEGAKASKTTKKNIDDDDDLVDNDSINKIRKSKRGEGAKASKTTNKNIDDDDDLVDDDSINKIRKSERGKGAKASETTNKNIDDSINKSNKKRGRDCAKVDKTVDEDSDESMNNGKKNKSRNNAKVDETVDEDIDESMNQGKKNKSRNNAKVDENVNKNNDSDSINKGKKNKGGDVKIKDEVDIKENDDDDDGDVDMKDVEAKDKVEIDQVMKDVKTKAEVKIEKEDGLKVVETEIFDVDDSDVEAEDDGIKIEDVDSERENDSKKKTSKKSKDGDKHQQDNTEDSSDSIFILSESWKKKNNEQDEKKKKKNDEQDEKKKKETSGESSASEVEVSKKKKRAGPKKKKVVVISDSEDDYKHPSESEKSSSDSDSKGVKRKKASASASGTSDEDAKKTTKKRRKRIVHRGDSSSENEEKADGDDLDSTNLSQNKGRRNIKKIIKDKDVAEATRSAAKDEEERKQRILDRQKTYNEVFELLEESASKKVEKVVLDFDPKDKKELISVDEGLVAKMKPHQANGVKFMWDACFESVERIKNDEGCGCILAHCMGLGKTFQVISLVHTILTHQELTKVRTVLVVCPFSTVLNWYGEFEKWLKEVENNDDLNVCHLMSEKINIKRAYRLKDWHEDGGVMIIGYDMYRNLTNETSKAIKKKMREVFQRTLVDPGPDLIVCDEGHMLKNEATALSKAMNKIKTLRRIVLTGTPLQNNLSEYHCMVNFVKPNLLGSKKEFTNRFVNPITNGQFADSTERDFKIMKRRAHVLHKMLDGLVQRRDYNVLTPYLPPKQEYVLSIRLSELQIQLYREFLETKVNITKGVRVTLFADFQQLSRIWTHPLALKYSLERQIKKDAENEADTDSAGSLKDFVVDSTDDDSSDASSSSSGSEGSTKKAPTRAANNRRMTRSNANNGDTELETMKDDPEVAAVSAEQSTTAWWNNLVKPEHFEDISVSSKLVLLFDFLKECELIGDKVLVFSQSLYSLDLIEHFLERIDDATQNNAEESFLMGHMSSWSKGLDYFRLDGSTSGENRSAWIKSFNKESNTRARLFLISTRAGGLGINLTAANRVIIFDASWNPSHDIQSIFRVYRFGQRKPCYIYRFIAQGTMEEKVYERQIAKLSLSQRVVDEQQVNRYFSQNDLQELYNFTPADPDDAPIPSVPKDRLMADMLQAHKKWIYKIIEHDSLLDHVEEEELDEEERKAAWEDYENEKKRGFAVQAPVANPFLQPGMAGMPTYENVRQMLLAQNPQIPKDDLHKLVTNMMFQLYVNQQQKDMMLRQQLQQQNYLQSMNAAQMGGQQPQQYQILRNTFNLPVTQQFQNQARPAPSATPGMPLTSNASSSTPQTSDTTKRNN